MMHRTVQNKSYMGFLNCMYGQGEEKEDAEKLSVTGLMQFPMAQSLHSCSSG